MPSAVDICNIALSHIGAEAVITSIAPPDGSVESGHCARFYPIARRAMIEMGAWGFAKTRVALAPVTNDSDIWSYAYAKPSDCLRALRVLSSTQALTSQASGTDPYLGSVLGLPTERGSANFVLEGDVLFCHEPLAVLLYLRDVVDTTKFTASFTTTLGMALAGYIAGPIIKGTEGARIGKAWSDQAQISAMRAGAADTNSTNERAEFMPGSIAARE